MIKQQHPDNPIHVNYAGHGTTCCDGKKKHWCLALPTTLLGLEQPEPITNQRLLVQKTPARLLTQSCSDGKDSNEKYLDVTNSEAKTFLITEEDKIKLLKPKNLIIDACRAGTLAANVESKQSKDVESLYLVASSLSYTGALERAGVGGVLFSALDEIVSNSLPNSCAVDLDEDGAVSERELSSFLLMRNLRDGFAGGTFPDKEKITMLRKKKTFVNEKWERKNLGVSIASDSCLMSTPTGCPKRTKPSGQKNCSEISEDFSNITKNLSRLQTDPSLLGKIFIATPQNSRLLLQGKPTSNKEAESNQEVQPKDANVIDQKRREALGFIDKWSTGLNEDAKKLCGNADCDISPGQKNFKEFIDYLSEIVPLIQ